MGTKFDNFINKKFILLFCAFLACLAFSLPAKAVYAESSNTAIYHKVEKGETLYSISRKYGISQEELCKANNINKGGILYYGKELKIPKKSSGNSAGTISAGQPAEAAYETASTAAQETGRTYSGIYFDRAPTEAEILKETNLDELLALAGYPAETKPEEISEKAGTPSDTDVVQISTVIQAPSKITFDVADVDIRDALSSLAISMGTSILYIDQAKNVTFHIENTPPFKVMELLLEKEGLSYLQEDNLIIVGKSDDLQKNFFTRMIVTKFSLSYITADKFNEQLDKLELPIKRMSVEGNPKAIWVQGTPQILAKVREAVNALDIPENANKEITIQPFELSYILADTLVSVVSQFDIGVRTISISENQKTVWAQGTQEELNKFKNLLKQLDVPGNKPEYDQITQINLKYIGADKIEPIMQKIGLNVKIITLEGNKQSIWVMGSAESLNDLKNIIKQLDIVDNLTIDAINSITQIKLNYISADKVVAIIQQSGINVRVFTVAENPYSLWIQGTEEDAYTIQNLVSTLDIESNRSDLIVFAYTLNNITAEQAIEGMSKMGHSDIQTIAISTRVSKSLLVICTEAMESTARGALFNLDMEASKIMNNAAKIKVPVDYSDNTNTLAARRDLISNLTGVSTASFRISGNVSRSSAAYYVLWLEDTTGNVKKVLDIIKLIDNPSEASAETSSGTTSEGN